MAATTLRFKLYNPDGKHVASFAYAEDAAALLGIYGRDAILRHIDCGAVPLWTEGFEEFDASDSYDGASKIIWNRVGAYLGKSWSQK